MYSLPLFAYVTHISLMRRTFTHRYWAVAFSLSQEKGSYSLSLMVSLPRLFFRADV